MKTKTSIALAAAARRNDRFALRVIRRAPVTASSPTQPRGASGANDVIEVAMTRKVSGIA